MTTTPETSNTPAPAPAPVTTTPTPQRSIAKELTLAVGQLRALVCGLALAMVGVSMCLNVFVYKQNRILSYTIGAQTVQIQQMQDIDQRLMSAVTELAQMAGGSPELGAIYRKYGLEVAPTAITAPQQPASSLPFAAPPQR